MADRFYGIDRGQDQATVDTSTTGLDVELVVDQAVNLTRKDVITLTDFLLKAVKEDENLVDV